MEIYVTFSRTIVGYFNVRTFAGGAQYNVRGDLFRDLSGIHPRAVTGTVAISTDTWRTIKADRWTRKIDAAGRKEVIA
ncbi:hypothetical protein [Bhargavaea beijingensis]|uniref:hypothetical protein n=1 Tax=Bhargavaea beijingensis TaxID=426756 RepID=UPI002224E372|nr:hypothetical protein [Bhargavaea beijingensis]MCW1926948.1 hypothetical protein [Bhargavaea beijingensis]